MVRSTLLPIQLHTDPKGETGGVTTIWSVDTFFDMVDDLNLLNIIKMIYGQTSNTKTSLRFFLLFLLFCFLTFVRIK